MCGIWGIFGTECEVYKYISCFFEIKHRGLDCFRFENIKHFENIGLGFHRLAFHDPITGMQPMKVLSIPHVIMIYNGEIYNFEQVCFYLFLIRTRAVKFTILIKVKFSL